jgi:hypothetical protein
MSPSHHPEPSTTAIKFTLLGVAELIEMQELGVPMYQRSYRWKPEEEVVAYWEDLTRAFKRGGEYFIGTVVITTEGVNVRKTIIDGQQRLVTTSLLIAAIRDELATLKNKKAEVIERDYLARETLHSEGKIPRLVLNPEDDSLFRDIASGMEPPAGSQKAPIRRSFDFLSVKVKDLSTADGEESVERLLAWADFLRSRVRIAVIEVPTEADAYVIFETLNNRGADLTTADLLKNFLYGRAGNSNLNFVRDRWMLSLGALELTAADAKFTAFLRHFWSSKHGLTPVRYLYSSIRGDIDSGTKARAFAEELSTAANYYSAIGNPTHEFWSACGAASSTDLRVLALLNLAPNRPLLLAAMAHFEPKELRKLLSALVSWSVRGMVTETINSGSTEEKYCDAAVEIRAGSIKTVDQVRTALATVIPTDSQFQAAFAIASVNKAATARYYLNALERTFMATAQPELIPNDDGTKVNLEHVLPQKSTAADWPGFGTDDERREWTYRVGNMVLLSQGKNGKIGNKPFAAKAPILKQSELALTRQVGDMPDWTSVEVEKRQEDLAKLAVTTWPR